MEAGPSSHEDRFVVVGFQGGQSDEDVGAGGKNGFQFSMGLEGKDRDAVGTVVALRGAAHGSVNSFEKGGVVIEKEGGGSSGDDRSDVSEAKDDESTRGWWGGGWIVGHGDGP